MFRSAPASGLTLAIMMTLALLGTPSVAAVPSAATAPASAAMSPATSAALTSATFAPALKTAVVPTKKRAAARYQTKVKTVLFTSWKGTKKAATIPADYTMKASKPKVKNKRLKVSYKGKSGWVARSKVSKVSSKTKLGKLSWAASAKKNIAPWCKGVPVRTQKNSGNYAMVGMRSAESITLSRTAFFGERLDPNHPLAVSIQFHECAHILQHRAYNHNIRATTKAMKKIYPKGLSVEHMADCIADVMGAKRTGAWGKYGGAYVSGYGGKCSKKQLKAAKRIVQGKRI